MLTQNEAVFCPLCLFKDLDLLAEFFSSAALQTVLYWFPLSISAPYCFTLWIVKGILSVLKILQHGTLYFSFSSSLVASQQDSQWTDAERELFTSGVAAYGKDFRLISLNVGTKSQSQCKAFFSKTRKRLCLDELVEQFQANEAAAMLVQSFRHDGGLAREVKLISTSEVRVEFSACSIVISFGFFAS